MFVYILYIFVQNIIPRKKRAYKKFEEKIAISMALRKIGTVNKCYKNIKYEYFIKML